MAHLRLDPWKIKICLARRKMTQANLCARTGISPSNFSTLLKKQAVSPVTAGIIAEAIGVDVLEIVEPPPAETSDQ